MDGIPFLILPLTNFLRLSLNMTVMTLKDHTNNSNIGDRNVYYIAINWSGCLKREGDKMKAWDQTQILMVLLLCLMLNNFFLYHSFWVAVLSA